MGMFGKGFDWKAAAIAFANPQAGAMYAKRRDEQAKDAQEAAELKVLHSTIDADPALSPEAKTYAKMNPKAYIENYMTRYQSRQFGAAGGSVVTPGANGQSPNVFMAPSRHEYQGSVYDVSGGAPGQKATVTPQHEGTQWVTPQPGTTAFGVNSFNGLPRSTTQQAPASPSDDDEWDYGPSAQGGAGRAAPRPFRGGFNPYLPR